MGIYLAVRDGFKKTKTKFILGCAFDIISSLILIYLVVLSGKIVDLFKSPTFEATKVYSYVALMIFLGLVNFLSFMTFAYLSFGSGAKLKMYYKDLIFRKILKKSPDFFQKNTAGDVIGLADNETKYIYEYFSFGILLACDSIFMPLICAIYLVFFLSWELTIAVMLPFVFTAIITNLISKKVGKVSEEMNLTFGKSSQEILEIIEGIKLIKSYVNEEVRQKNISKIIKYYFDLAYLESNLWMMSFLSNSFIRVVSMVIGLFYGAFLVRNGSISIGKLVTFFGLGETLAWSFWGLGDCINTYKRALVSINRINLLLDDETEIEDGDKILEDFSTMEFKNFSFYYPEEKEASLKDISFKLNKGETLGIVGKSGSGKSTLVKQILRFYNFDKNKVFINNIPYEEYDITSVRSKFGYVSQENILLSKTVRENILFGSVSEDDERIINVIKKADFYKDIQNLEKGLDTVVGERGLGLSGGQKQRISLARALYRDPEILVLDDSFSAIDANTESKIINSLKENRKNRTNIIISHRISAVEHADLILVMDNGKIVDRGTHEELISKDSWYKEQFEYQSLDKEEEDEE
ncbi:ABC transporter ATP-binding protein/permease [Parvimonas micra]|uniref:ABC transporter ATP-binding protein n=1 Tax=Parvimonas micra TaxID=33033 RepID=UPI001E319319|nr:ABC transporter ATP-binding protein [Parvimonas micra]MCE3020556.1 ABC transporter ATP-binding protein/permease [Parvimonas micra]